MVSGEGGREGGREVRGSDVTNFIEQQKFTSSG